MRFAIPHGVKLHRPQDLRRALSYAVGLNNRIIQNATIATTAEAGMVRTQAHTMRVATPQRTAEIRLVVPTPMIAPVIVCVVLTGIPARPFRTA